MIRINHILKEVWRNTYRNPGSILSGILSMTLLFLLFSLFWIAVGTSDQFYEELLSDLKMEVFVAEGIADSSLADLTQKIQSVEGIDNIEYISKDKAREELSRLVGIDLLVGYDTINPLPQSFILSFEPQYLTTESMSGIENRIVAMDAVSHVYYSRNWLEKAETTKGIILNIGMMLGLLILLAVLITSANNIRLMARTRATGFHQMRLLGAGKLFLAFPFLIEGFFVAGLSAAAGWFIIFYWKDKVDFTQFVVVFPSYQDIAIFCGLAAIVGVVSGYVGIRRLLRL